MTMCLIINYTKSTIQVYKCDTLASVEDDVWQSIISSLESGNRVEIVIVVYGTEFVVKKTSVYLICGEPNNEEMENSHVIRGGVFKLELFLPEEYPMAAPKVRFLTKIYHPYAESLGDNSEMT
ncbi:uncharacterized protein [Arachis hypogaea]|uniref:uncharacterized protein isoform X1 n=1 Tax=Arachis hypogaea TaxID=3818 RepID=UPI000DECC380|nr:uncharacterized protein LOC112740338 isoform X1 [Arachis hypogaea]XP_025644879.1 uncharacterized protein LOC112740338 isoform X1 [Arachis hypogaea]